MNTKTCPVCGKEFGHNFKPSRLAKAKYCGHSCQQKDRKDPNKRKVFTCAVCGKQFETWAYRNPSACSPECRGRMAKGIPHPTRRRPESFITRNCDHCGKPYTLHKVFFEQRNSRFCSIECRAARQSIEKRGAGNVNYRGGTIKDRGQNWERQKRATLKRDGNTCQICHKKLGRKGWDYGVHHITPYKTFEGDFETANQLSNLITLCRKCHSDVERGKRDCPRPLF